MKPAISRRHVLLGGAAATVTLALAACTSSATPDPNGPPPTGADDPDFTLRTSVVAAEALLIATYDATIAAHPDAKAELQTIRDNHAAHLAAVNTAGSISVPTPQAPQIPASLKSAMLQLAVAEASAAAARGSDCLAAQRWQFARELALVGASEASHRALLTGGAA